MSRRRLPLAPRNAPAPHAAPGAPAPHADPGAPAAPPTATSAALPAPRPGPLAELARQSLLATLCVAAFSTIYDPLGWWPLAFICLFPWALMVTNAHRAWLAHWMSYLAGSAFFLINLRWLLPVTGLGYAALALYVAIYWALAGWAVRAGFRRGLPVAFCLPVAWTAVEILRGTIMTGFPWFFLGHALYRQTSLIQISDLGGVHAVSFLAAALNGLVADVYFTLLAGRRGRAFARRLWIPVAFTLLLAAASAAYGSLRLRTARVEPGPRVAVIQEDFPLVSQPPYGEPGPLILARYLRLAADAARQNPDIVLFPETTWSAVQNKSFLAVAQNVAEGVEAGAWRYGKLCDEAINAFARGDYRAVNRTIATFRRALPEHRFPDLPDEGGPPVTVVLGAMSVEQFPHHTYPRVRKYNSALVYDPDGVQRDARYDKVHLVPFGEYVPFRFGRLHWLYVWLNSLSPFSRGGTYEYSLSSGTEFTTFPFTHHGRTLRFGTPICYEDATASVVRRYVWDAGQRRADFLLNISNDGWFLHSAELPQHLATAVFRAIENRVGIARAVNTGISGFIDPSGRLYSLVTAADGRTYGPGTIGWRVDHVLIDRRASLYGRVGDAFAWACVVLAVPLWMDAFVARWRRRRMRRLAPA